ncbi:hypothetical protein [Microbacterium gallinarum]|uniref:Uncharacterized protein n=1 Tax=Microbacterium gallinarum TaxID=2762209 RepID=A0ABR8X2H2_9MICO|nr:hypothetical protein [Microbacterium gallinarum]MBD8023392.1 hypothetical protein [Microbacterium gallinarum]
MCLPWEAARAAAASEAIGLTPVLTGATFDSRNGGDAGDTPGRGIRLPGVSDTISDFATRPVVAAGAGARPALGEG